MGSQKGKSNELAKRAEECSTGRKPWVPVLTIYKRPKTILFHESLVEPRTRSLPLPVLTSLALQCGPPLYSTWSSSDEVARSDGNQVSTGSGSDRVTRLALSSDKCRMSTRQGHVSTEQGHVFTEQGRMFTEQGRMSTEQGRVFTEQGRMFTEQGHVSIEQDRMSTEQGRMFTEQCRMFTEQGRMSTEQMSRVD